MRLIDTDKLLEKTECLFKDLNSTEDYMGIGYNHGVGDSIAIIKNAPTIEAEPVKHGKWITDNNKQTKCSICGRPIPIRKVRHNGEVIWEDNSPVNYCPCCGAKMKGVEK